MTSLALAVGLLWIRYYEEPTLSLNSSRAEAQASFDKKYGGDDCVVPRVWELIKMNGEGHYALAITSITIYNSTYAKYVKIGQMDPWDIPSERFYPSGTVFKLTQPLIPEPAVYEKVIVCDEDGRMTDEIVDVLESQFVEIMQQSLIYKFRRGPRRDRLLE